MISQAGEAKRKLIEDWSSTKWLTILANMNDVYINGQSKMEAFWRTMISDHCSNEDLFIKGGDDLEQHQFPAPITLEDSFRD